MTPEAFSPTKAVSKEKRELVVSKRNDLLRRRALLVPANDVETPHQSPEGLVDLRGLSLRDAARPLPSLGSCEVDDEELGVRRLDAKDAVRARRLGVKLRLRRPTLPSSAAQDVHRFVEVGDRRLGESLDDDLVVRHLELERRTVQLLPNRRLTTLRRRRTRGSRLFRRRASSGSSLGGRGLFRGVLKIVDVLIVYLKVRNRVFFFSGPRVPPKTAP